MIEINLSYLVCATPRTGSNFLCEVLSSTGVAGYPGEYFWQRSFWYQRRGVATSQHLSIGRVNTAPLATAYLARSSCGTR
jgi:LPS sulfotransferase NodH